jgi:FAD synthase
MNEHHVFEGEVNKKGNVVGYHHTGSPTNNSNVDTVTKPPDKNGVYEAQVNVDKGNGTFGQKRSSMFPDTWSPDKVKSEIQGAYQNSYHPTGTPPNKWEGTSPSGVKIQGYTDPKGNINTSFPVYKA